MASDTPTTDRAAASFAVPAPRIDIPLPLFSHYPAIPPPLRLNLFNTGTHPCSYFPDRHSSNRAFWAEEMPAEVYHAFMDSGFRRSGKVVYQPACHGCRRCLSLRVPVESFVLSKSHRRCWRKNADLSVTIQTPEPDLERFELYRTYQAKWHGKPGGELDDENGYQSFVQFLYDSPVQTLEYAYRNEAGRLLAIGICDLSPLSLSTVYFYYDPAEAKRGLGTYGALFELEDARRRGVPYYYMGYWVDGCKAMDYKASYQPHEVLHTDGIWRPSGLK